MMGEAGIGFRADINIIGTTEKIVAKKARILKISDYQFSLSEEFKSQDYEGIEVMEVRDISNIDFSNPKFRIFIRPERGIFY